MKHRSSSSASSLQPSVILQSERGQTKTGMLSRRCPQRGRQWMRCVKANTWWANVDDGLKHLVHSGFADGTQPPAPFFSPLQRLLDAVCAANFASNHLWHPVGICCACGGFIHSTSLTQLPSSQQTTRSVAASTATKATKRTWRQGSLRHTLCGKRGE